MVWNGVAGVIMESWSMYKTQMQQQEHGDESQRTLYVGNLSKEVTQDYILYLFSQIGDVKGCKMIQDPNGVNDPYCFVEFNDRNAAEHAKHSVNGRVVIGRNIKVNWATTSAKKEKFTYQRGTRSFPETFSLFVGDLAPEVDQDLLTKAFRPYGLVADARVVKDMNTGHSKGYGFVAFARESDAENAMKQMSGAVLGGKPIRTNWASRKQNQSKGEAKEYKSVFDKTSEANTTVYIGNTPDSFSEAEVRNMFETFGQILEVRVYPDRNYAFVKYSDHDQAAQAIVGCHGQTVQDRPIRCDWGKEDNQPKQTPFQQQPQQQFSGNPPPGMYSQQQYVGGNQSQVYPYFDSMMMQTGQFSGYGQDASHSTFMGQGSNSAATSQGGFGYQQQ
ncbi:cytotoxic granule associated RNA binding protein TIA1-like isoform X5 [Apostichopus japonicus]|uniref:cytotoxic granule associated RNA binding protein TIA1-like isoform X5 n=1 Tax=Stichopus japonicus TaxID=307972 RepID=UPI003AB40CFC